MCRRTIDKRKNRAGNESAGLQIKKADKLNQYLVSLQEKGKDISVLNIENDQCVLEEINAGNSKYYCYDIAKEKGTK